MQNVCKSNNNKKKQQKKVCSGVFNAITLNKFVLILANEIVSVSLILTLNIVLILDLALGFLMLTLNRQRKCLLEIIHIVHKKFWSPETQMYFPQYTFTILMKCKRCIKMMLGFFYGCLYSRYCIINRTPLPPLPLPQSKIKNKCT